MTPMTDDEMIVELLGEVVNRTAERDDAQRCWEIARKSIEALKPDASLGALVRRIREHEMANRTAPCVTALRLPTGYPTMRDFFDLTEQSLTDCLSHLDSLLPKEPEVVVHVGGRKWTFGTSPVGNTNVWWRPGDGTATVVASGELELALNALNALGGGNAK